MRPGPGKKGYVMRGPLARAVAEALGTFTIVFVGCGAMMVRERFSAGSLVDSIPLVFGLAVTGMIYALGHISGAHFNPAVTLAFAVARHFPKREVILYWLAQFLGAGFAVGALAVLLPAGKTFGATIPAVAPLMALGWEAVLTGCLMLVIVAVATDTRAVGTMAGVVIGSTVTLCALVGGAVTGASLNPARSLAPALAQGSLSSVWVYLVGPPIGAVLAALLYEWIRCEARTPEGRSTGEEIQKGVKGCC